MNLYKLFNHRAQNITSAAFILGFSSLISKILGLAREMVFAYLFGAGEEMDIYFTAFRIPDFLFNVLVLGAISTAFIPVFTDYYGKSKKEAWQLCNNIVCIFLSCLIIFGIILTILTPYLMRIVAPGFTGEKLKLVITMTRIMFLSPIILGISHIFGSVLQYFSRFLIYSLAPIMYNVGIIFGAIFLVPRIGILGLALGVVTGAVLHLLIQIPALLLTGYRFRFLTNLAHKGVQKILRLMIPRAIGLTANQINLIIITAIASTLATGSISVFNYANNLQYIPVSLFGFSFATAAFPVFARSFSLKTKNDFLRKFISTFSQILFFTLPLSILFFLLRAQIIRAIYGLGKFTWEDTRLTAASLGLFAFSISAQALIPLISKAFYAFQDTKTPVKISIISVSFNILLSFYFTSVLSSPNDFYYFLISVLKLEGVTQASLLGLPLAFSISSFLNAFLLLTSLRRKIGDYWNKKLGKSFFRILLLSLGIGIVTFGLLRFFSLVFDLQTFFGVLSQMVFSGGIGLLLYIYLTKILKFPEYNLFFDKKKNHF